MNETDIITRERIIEAAKGRFRHYGYFKTTMAEVAHDCEMSPGNLYRYFKGKIDIATEIAREESIAQIERLRPLIECPFRSARQRLQEIVFQELRDTFHQLENNKKVVELVQYVMHERPRFLVESLRRERRVLAIVLEHGRQSGEFNLRDSNAVAATLQAATMKFHYPQLFTHQTLEDLEDELTRLFDLLFVGLLNPNFAPETEGATEEGANENETQASAI